MIGVQNKSFVKLGGSETPINSDSRVVYEHDAVPEQEQVHWRSNMHRLGMQ